ncbi:MAG: hypothetical protein RL514_4408 [Verrucomicrobiota bacterium]
MEVAKQKASTTCFCPGGGGDWEPMVKLHHLCDTFIYADLCADGEESAASLRGFFEGIGGTLRGELRFVEARELSLGTELCDCERFMGRFLDEHCPASAAAYREAVQPLAQQERWGVEALLRHGVNEEGRDIRVLFLQGEALACYQGLYAIRKLAPHAVVLPPQGGRRTLRSQQLSLAGPLGAVLRAEPRPTLALAGLEDVGALTGSPWPHLWRELGEWNRAAFTSWPLPAHWWHDARHVWA